jgi:ABC-type nickel/cobalt efflux system permease component RcnA
MKRILISILLIFILQSISFTQQSPFAPKKEDNKKKKTVQYPSFIQKIFKRISPIQHRLNNKLAELTQKLKEEKSLKTFLLIIFISFVFGVVHGMGPGHGKTITFSYFLSNKKANIKTGILMGSLIAFMHACSALIIVLTLYAIIKKSFLSSFENLSSIIRLISYGLITIIGLFLLLKSVINPGKKKNFQTSKNYILDKGMLPIIFAIGIIPCPGAVIILLFSISMEILKVGIISTFFMATGMAFTISSVGILTIITKKGILKLASDKNRLITIFQKALELIGASLILLFGLFLFLYNISI